MELTQADYTLFTGETESFDDEDWERIVNVAGGRLASFLCLETLPTPLPDDLAMLLANFICAMLKFRGNTEPTVSSKSVRNFTISFTQSDAANVFAQVAGNFGDVIEKYSDCGAGFKVESTCPSAYDWAGYERF